MAIRPLILVQTNPQVISKDSSMIISARFYNRDTMAKQPVKDIFLNIISEKDGHVVWPLEVIRHDTWKMDIEISTAELQNNTTYLVRVSNNHNLSPQGRTTFEVKKKGLGIIPVPILPIPIGVDPSDIEKKPRTVQDVEINEITDSIVTEDHFMLEDTLTRKQIEYKKFVTQMDSRVCPKCIEAFNGSSPDLKPSYYWPDDPNAPEIPVHYGCRCTLRCSSRRNLRHHLRVWQK